MLKELLDEPINLDFIEGLPKHKPNTNEQPAMPLTKGSIILLPKPDLALGF